MNAILAQTIDRQFYLRSMHEQFSKPNPNLWWEILLGVALVAGIIGLVMLSGKWQVWRSQRGEVAPLGLYRRVLTHIGLSVGQMWRLWRLAKAAKLAHPTALLLSVELYDEAVAAYCSGHGWLGARSRTAPAFAAIRRRLFEG